MLAMSARHFFGPALLTLLAGCGAAPPDVEAPATPAAKKTGAPTPDKVLDDATFELSKDGSLIGKETWKLQSMSDGSLRYDVDALLEMRGTKVTGKGFAWYEKPLRPTEARFDLQVGGETVRASIKREGNTLVATNERPGQKPETRKDTKSSTMLIPEPLLVGYAPICLGKDMKSDDIVIFPGAEVSLMETKPLGGDGAKAARLLVLDVGGTSRIEIACEGDKLAAVRIPLAGFEAVRKGSEAVMQKMVALSERKKPEVPAELEELERTVTVLAKDKDKEAKLACSLLLPKERDPKKKLPAVLFVTGSGPQDRDEDSIGPGGLKLSIFKTLAIRLGQAGIASMRCDDRGYGKSTGEFLEATLATFVRDARASLEALKKEAAVDPKRVGVIGHSEGGVIAPLVATQDKAVKAVALMSAPGRELGKVVELQLERQLKMMGGSAEDTKTALDRQRQVNDAIAKGAPLPDFLPEPEKKALEAQRGWIQSHLKNNPADALKKMPRIPVLVAQGGKDAQVLPEDADMIAKTLRDAKNEKVTLKTYPELHHLFAPTKTGSMADYADPAAKVDETFVKDLVGFVRQNL